MKSNLSRTIIALLILVYGLLAVTRVFSAWDMPPAAQVALAILLIAATLWVSESVPLFVTSFIVMFLCLVWLMPVMADAGNAVKSDKFLAPFFSNIILLFLGGFVLSAGLHKYQLDEQLAQKIIGFTGRSIPKVMLGVMMITAFLSMWLSNTATAAMMLSLIMPMVARLPEGDSYRKALILSIPFAANVGGLGTPIGSPPNAIAIQYMSQLGIAPGFNQWMMIGIPGVIVILALAWLVLQVIFRGKSRLNTEVTDHTNFRLKWSGKTMLVLIGTIVTVLGWVTTSWHKQATGTIALIPVILFFGTGVLNVRDLRSLSWDVLLLMGGGLCLGAAISESGLATWVISQLPIDQLGLHGIVILFGVLACVMSSVMSNTATANLLMPIVLGLSMDSVSPVFIGVAMACSVAMPLPISTPPNAMAFSSGELKVADMVKPGLILTAVSLVLALSVGYWWWGVVLG